MQQPTEWRIGRNFIRVGDEVKVKPGVGAKTSFVAKVTGFIADDDGEVTHVEIYGGPRGVIAARTVAAERVVRIAQTKGGEARQRIRDLQLLESPYSTTVAMEEEQWPNQQSL